MTVTHPIRLTALFLFLCLAPRTGATEVLPRALPIAGDWDVTHTGDEPGFYNTKTRTFFLCSARWAPNRLPCTSYVTPDAGGHRVPLAGRWAVDDTADRPALYEPSTGLLLLYRFTDCLPHQCNGRGGLALDRIHDVGAIKGATAVSGDWDGDGIDTLALIQPPTLDQPTSTARLLAPDQVTFVEEIQLMIDARDFQPISGRWPGNRSPGDSLGFFQPIDNFVLLYDGKIPTQLTPIQTSLSSLLAMSGDWGGGDALGLYVPRNAGCPPGACHRAAYFSGEAFNTFEPLERPHPHLDSRFPDDPGDPAP